MDRKLANKPHLRELALSDDCFVTTIALMAISALGIECLDWDPEVVLSEFERAYDISKLPSRACDKLQTGLTLIGTDAFTSTIEGFLSCTRIMNNKLFDNSEIPYCDIRMCSWSICEYLQLMEDGNSAKDVVFAPEITIYIQKVGNIHGISKFPPWMAFADDDSGNLPDMTGDISMFEMYSQRQGEYVDMLVAEADEKQKKLGSQLKILKDAGILVKPA